MREPSCPNCVHAAQSPAFRCNDCFGFRNFKPKPTADIMREEMAAVNQEEADAPI